MKNDLWVGKLVRLRQLEPHDAPLHAEWDSDTEMARLIDEAWMPASLSRAQRWVEGAIASSQNTDTGFFHIESLAGEQVGFIAATNCKPRHGTFNYSVMIATNQRRKGYATEAIVLVLNYYFNELRYNKVTTPIYPFNPMSITLHEKLGFVLEGRIRAVIYADGRYYDELFYGLLRDEFNRLHRPDLVE